VTEETTENTKATFEDMPEEELAKFVLDFCDGKIFSSAHISKEQDGHILGMVFMPLSLGALSNYTEEEIKNIGLVYEYYDKAGPRGINDYPMFFSCRMMTSGDWAKASQAIKREEERRKDPENSKLNPILEDLRK